MPNIDLCGKQGDIVIGEGFEPPLIAEAGVLTWGDKGRGFLFVNEAVKAGIKLLKFQCFNADNVVGREYSWHKRLKQRELSKETFLEIMEYGKIRGINVFASTHNEYDMMELSDNGMSILKLGAGDSNNFRMIDLCLETGKPVILSLGLLTRNEIFDLLNRYKNQFNQLIPLWCRTMYPTPPEATSLGFLKVLKEKFPQFNFGYSDHTSGSAITLAASLMREVLIIEKHFCFETDRTNPQFLSWDINGALTTKEMIKLLSDIKDARNALKDSDKYDELMIANRDWAHKAIVAKCDIPLGTELTSEHLMSLRPYDKTRGHISIKNFSSLIGKKITRDFKKNEYITENDLI